MNDSKSIQWEEINLKNLPDKFLDGNDCICVFGAEFLSPELQQVFGIKKVDNEKK